MTAQEIKGTVIHGTLRSQDLVPAFRDCLAIVNPEASQQLEFAAFLPVPSYVMEEGDTSKWWESGDCQFLLENLFDALNDAAPEGYFFGSHPGDGSDFGFWEIEDNE